ncbi:MAG: beta-hydroxyacyl-ACP dehydratase [Deltaproteobacteria bacterium]|jgi:3-hydroxyacyl-[acyl-carrier-protein] dehydratase|nr:beta-hydroxyacyl-ACP dehydratase [Deltaproteobacteria bacterium]
MADNEASEAERRQVLELLPQQRPFRFIDEILELTENNIVSSYRFREDEYFYAGHFPADPVTPGVILIEAMAQAGLVALGIYLLQREDPTRQLRTLFSECSIEFFRVVAPGSQVTVAAERIYWRRNKLRSQVEMRLHDGAIVASGCVSGMGVLLK